MPATIEKLSEAHREPVIDIFNHYVEHGFAAYPENKVPYAFFDMLTAASQSYPAAAVVEENGRVAGFALLRKYHPMPAFDRTAQITYFLAPDAVGRGLGGRLLAYLEEGALKLGVEVILADISSRNEGSILFHAKHGFKECGRFERVGRKLGVEFDQVWMKKDLKNQL